MNISHLETLVAIVDTGSLKNAAHHISLTQSAISYSLSRLEAELGVKLIERGRHGIKVTQVGEEIVENARAALGHIDTIRQLSASERNCDTSAKVRLGCVSYVPERLISGIIRDFNQHHPQIELVQFDGTPEELTNWLHNGIIDVATLTVRESFPNEISFVLDCLELVVSARHPLAQESIVPLERVVDQLFIGPSTEYEIVNQMLVDRDISPFQSYHEVSSYPTIFSMISEGIGLSIMPRSLIDHENREIVSIPVTPDMNLYVKLVNSNNTTAALDFMNRASYWARTHGFLPDST